jgi:hypothetical protein
MITTINLNLKMALSLHLPDDMPQDTLECLGAQYAEAIKQLLSHDFHAIDPDIREISIESTLGRVERGAHEGFAELDG